MRETVFLAPSRSVLTLVFLSFVFFSCTEISDYDERSINRALADSLLNITETWNFELDLIEDTRRVVTLRAPYAVSHQDVQSKTDMTGPVQVWVRNEEGDTTITLTSESAIYTARQSQFVFIGDVRVQTREDKRLYTELLNWHQRERTISTDEFVSITTPADSIAGFGLEGTDDLSDYVISRVTGEFEISSD